MMGYTELQKLNPSAKVNSHPMNLAGQSHPLNKSSKSSSRCLYTHPPYTRLAHLLHSPQEATKVQSEYHHTHP